MPTRSNGTGKCKTEYFETNTGPSNYNTGGSAALILTMYTDVSRNRLHSSSIAFIFNLYVSSSTLSTRFCCCRESIRFCICSLVMGDGGIMMGPPSIDDESLSLALSAIVAVETNRRWRRMRRRRTRNATAGWPLKGR